MTHIWPYIILLFIGIFVILSFENIIALVIGFICCVIGTAYTVHHFTVDEHFKQQ